MPFSKFIKKYGKRLNCSKVTCSFSNWVYEWSLPKTKTPYVELGNKGQGLVSVPSYNAVNNNYTSTVIKVVFFIIEVMVLQ